MAAWPERLPRPLRASGGQRSRAFDNLPRFPTSLPENWQSWPELTVRIHELPSDVSTTMVWENLQQYGDIVYIDVYQNPRSVSFSARVKFSPPPVQAFWDPERFKFSHPDTTLHPAGISVTIRPDTGPPAGWVSSTIDEGRSYAGRISVLLQGVAIGSRTGPLQATIAECWYHEQQQPEFRLELNVHDKQLCVHFHTPIQTSKGSSLRSYRMKIEVSQLRRVYRTSSLEEQETYVVPLAFPPEYWWRREDIPSMMYSRHVWGEKEAWYRASFMADNFDGLKYPVSVSSNVEEPGYVDLGRCTTCQFLVAPGQGENLGYLREALEDLNVKMQDAEDFEVVYKKQPPMWQHLDHSDTPATNASAMLEMWSEQVHLPFEVRYQFEVCISRGYLHEHNVSRALLEKMASSDPIKVQDWLEKVADRARPVYDPMASFIDFDVIEAPEKRRTPEFCYIVRKAVITPTAIYLNSPSIETSNRVIRKYNHVVDRFLKVQFVEEGERGRLRAAAGQNNDEIWKRIWRTLNQGIRIGDRVYKFLAFGNSQLRECGAYFFSPTDHVSCDDIRRWAGDFDHIKVIAKYAARLGQCFSTTRVLQGIPNPRIVPIPDIERNGHCFTDGVGKISKLLADFIAAEMPGNAGERPSAFQFRMGGSKGVLVVSDDAKGKEVHIRPSQEKFKAQFNGLEIVRCARPATATLNRQTITILSDLNVPDRAFISLLEQQLRKYDESAKDDAVAIELLTKFVDQNQTSLIIAELLRSGFRTNKLREPFVLNIFSLWRSWSLKLLKEKAKIHIEKSAFVIGCVDETGTLRGHSAMSEGTRVKDTKKLPQIFLQTVNPNTGKTFVLEGVCIVGRNPSLHPGDIRVVQAVDCPKLRHLKDVVVFPSKGDRPVPNMLSGGDLDGDDFFVIWEPTLMPQIWNWRPMDFSPAKPMQLARDVNALDLQQFFVQYAMNDVLALIAISHLAWADQMKPRSSICLKLAEMHSRAVDFPKTGEPVAWDWKEMGPKRWPHFMENKGRSYDSTQVLGRLYDNVTKEKIAFEPDWNHAFDRRVLERYELEESSLAKARRLKADYDRCVRRILAQLNLGTEFELWTGFSMTKPVVGTNYKMHEVLGQEAETLRIRFRGLCEEAAGGSSQELIDPFVAAMYKVTEEETTKTLRHLDEGASSEDEDDDLDWNCEGRRQLRANKMPLITFPWLFPEVVVRIALGDQWVQKKPWYSAFGKPARTEEPIEVSLRPPHIRFGSGNACSA